MSTAGSRSVDEHLAAVRDLLGTVRDRVLARAPETVPLGDPALHGRVVATSLSSLIPLPPFHNSQMDGYAVLAADLADATDNHPVALRIGFTTAAGDTPALHEPGTASPIMTGAAIPDGADAVVPIEAAHPPRFTELSRAGAPAPQGEVSFTAPVPAGQFVRGAGSDLHEGAEIIAAGTRLTAACIGALAAAGITEAPVVPRTRVVLCSTGDELEDLEAEAPSTGGPRAETPRAETLAPGRIYDANTPMLAAALRAAGAEVRTLRTGDRPDALQAALSDISDEADLVVTSGGISAGAFEVVRESFAPVGGRFVKVSMQPGGPQGLGLLDLPGSARSLAALCFPGNPVSAMLSAELFLLPALRELAGLPSETPREERLLAQDADSPADKLQLRRGRLTEDGRVALTGPSSHLLVGLASADVIAELPPGVGFAAENTPVTVWRISV